jgi:hypothetical protein
MSSALRFAVASLTAVVLIAPPVIAKPVCNAAVLPCPAPAQQAGANAASPSSDACPGACLAQISNEMTATDTVPVPAHLPVVSSPDEIASWHAEIFDRISRADARATVCKLEI